MPLFRVPRCLILLYVSLLPLGNWSCTAPDDGYEAPADALFASLPVDETGLDFLNTVTEGEEYNLLSYRNFYNGAGWPSRTLTATD